MLNTTFGPNTYSYMLLDLVADYVRGTGLVPVDEVDAWESDVRRQGERGTYLFNLNQYLFMGRKPS